jgi:predicted transcriptional regulator
MRNLSSYSPIRINRLEQEINKNCDAFIRDLVTEINEMYRNAIAYYSELSRKYAIVGFQMDRSDYDTSAKIHFDAMHTVEDQVAADLKLLRKRMRFMNDILSDKKVESTLRDTIISFKILVRDTNKIREDLKAELERFMEAVKQQLEEHLSEIEASLNSLEIDDLYTFQM